jgi:hypothetical protein
LRRFAPIMYASFAMNSSNDLDLRQRSDSP